MPTKSVPVATAESHFDVKTIHFHMASLSNVNGGQVFHVECYEVNLIYLLAKYLCPAISLALFFRATVRPSCTCLKHPDAVYSRHT